MLKKKLRSLAPSPNGIDTDKARELIASSNLPIRAGRLNSGFLENKGMETLRSYLKSPTFASDHSMKKGLNIYGGADQRSDALCLVAKMFVFGGQSAYYTTTHALIATLDNPGSEKRQVLSRVDNLFIDWFERDFRTNPSAHGSVERPYSFYQLVNVEEFLNQRRQSELVTFFGSRCAWDNHKWWSRDFLEALCDNVIDIKVGK